MMPVSLLATLSVLIVVPVATLLIGGSCVIAALLRFPDGAGSPYDVLPRLWSRILLAAAGVRVVVHNTEIIKETAAHVFIANHVSWYDIPALGSFLPRAKFVAKAELFQVPVLGGAMRAVGMVPIERQNRRAAFGAYNEAAKRIREGNSVVVFAEGTRGSGYQLRSFKRGPFMLAIDAGASVVPVLLYGTLQVIRRGSTLVHPGRVDVHLLEPVSVEGYDYEGREELAEKVRSRIADALLTLYGIESQPQKRMPASPTTGLSTT